MPFITINSSALSSMEDDMNKILPIINTSGSDSAMLDNALEFMVMNGMDLPLAVMITIPEPWENNKNISHMASMYRAEIDKIKGTHFDAAFVPLDPRQEKHYADGMLYFLKHVDCNAVFPMHYWNEPSVIDRFITEYPQYKSRIKNTESAKGEEI